MLSTFEAVLANFSLVIALILLPVVFSLPAVVFWRRFKRRNPLHHEPYMEGVELERLGDCSFTLDHAASTATAVFRHGPLPGKLRLVIGPGGSKGEPIGCPALDGVCQVERLSEDTRSNLAADCSRLAPFLDFVLGWAGEVKNITIEPGGAEIKFRFFSKKRGYLPGKRLPAFLKQAGTGLSAFYRAAIDAPMSSGPRPADWLRHLVRFRHLLAMFWFWVLAVGLLFTTSVAGAVMSHFEAVQRDRQAMSWPGVQGKVTASRVKHWTTSRSSGSSRHGGSSSRTTHHYKAIIEYEYTVGGITRRNKRYSFFKSDVAGKKRAPKRVAEHPPGKAVKVFYDPAAPEEAILRRYGRGPDAGDQSLMVVGFLFGLLAVSVGLSGVLIPRAARKRLRKREETW